MLNDKSPMPYGAHKGKSMENVPAEYLIWLYDNNKAVYPVKRYIEDNMNVLKKEVWGRK